MPVAKDLQSKHFTLEKLAEGVYACIHKQGGGAFSNAGIIDLGDRTTLVDAFDTRAAGSDLRRIAEVLFDRPVDTIVLTHVHSDHWGGASVFENSTTLLTTKAIQKESMEWGKRMQKDYEKPEEWEEYLQEMETQLQTETDERVRVGLERSIERARYTMAEMADFEPRYADKNFKDQEFIEGSERFVEVWDYGPGHSEDDVVLFIPQDKIAFIGDIGFFDQQPFMGFCHLDKWRAQIQRLLGLEYDVLVPGHGPLGGITKLTQQLKYFDVMEDLIGEVVKKGGSLEEAMNIELTQPFDSWLMGSMARWEMNVQYVYKKLGGDIKGGDG
jgi:cyclase